MQNDEYTAPKVEQKIIPGEDRWAAKVEELA
jgi:hypothetical protein